MKGQKTKVFCPFHVLEKFETARRVSGVNSAGIYSEAPFRIPVRVISRGLKNPWIEKGEAL